MANIGEIVLNNRRIIHLRLFTQRLTYGGLLEGLPTVALNQRIIDRVVSEERATSDNHAPYLIAPTQTPIVDRDDRPYPFGEPATLPGIVCVARFRSYQPARDPTMDYSQLALIWFQADCAFPIDAAILDHIQQLDWNQYAYDDYH